MVNQKLSKNVNQWFLTVISYCLTFVTGIAVILPFVVKQSVAGYFSASIGYIGYVFSFFMIGMIAAQFFNGTINAAPENTVVKPPVNANQTLGIVTR